MRIPERVTVVDRVLVGLVVLAAAALLCLAVAMVAWAFAFGIVGSERSALLMAIVLIPACGAFLLAEHAALVRGNSMVAFFVAVVFLGFGVLLVPGCILGVLGLLQVIPPEKGLNSWSELAFGGLLMLFVLRTGIGQWRWFRGLSGDVSAGHETSRGGSENG